MYTSVSNFLVEASSFYLDVVKDVLYAHPTAHPLRRSAQTVLHHLCLSLLLLLAPIVPHTAQEMYSPSPFTP